MGHQIKQLSRTRLAPTPSGFLHRGNILNFYLIWKMAKQFNMRILLRIDDLDAARTRPNYVNDIFYVLEKLKIDWDEGPQGVDDFYQNWSQQKRLPLYLEFINKLKQKNALYACSCSRRAIGEGQYSGLCRNKNLSYENNPWRVCMKCGKDFIFGKNIIETSHLEDPIVWRREMLPAYHIANIVDDLHFGVSNIIRGEDLFSSTLTQLALAQIAETEEFTTINFYHHPLIVDLNGKKLSKSTQSNDHSLFNNDRFNDFDKIKQTADVILQSLTPLNYRLKMPGK